MIARRGKGSLAVVAGAGGFIGGFLVRRLLAEGFSVRAIDIKPQTEWYQCFEDADNFTRDLSLLEACREMLQGAEGADIYNLAADMGGMGFIETNKALCTLSVLINTHLLVAARDEKIGRYFYASSACVYNAAKQCDYDVAPLKEEDAYPAMPEDGYGWEKLFSERACRHFTEDFGLVTRVARFHNVYGPHGTYDGGREKAPAAICRKVIEAQQDGSGAIEIWGDGRQTRSFMYIDDCVEGIRRIMESGLDVPINLGSAESVDIDGLVSLVEEIAKVRLRRRYRLDAPRGVNGRNSDNTLIIARLGWEPQTPLRRGLESTYRWIAEKMGFAPPSPQSRPVDAERSL